LPKTLHLNLIIRLRLLIFLTTLLFTISFTLRLWVERAHRAILFDLVRVLLLCQVSQYPLFMLECDLTARVGTTQYIAVVELRLFTTFRRHAFLRGSRMLYVQIQSCAHTTPNMVRTIAVLLSFWTKAQAVY
jgi:hypothetical protein